MIKKVEWDSDFFNLEVGEITEFEAISNQHHFDLIYAKSDKDLSLVLDGFTNGFSETKLVFSKNITSFAEISPQIRSANDNDSANEIYKLAFESGKFSRFKLDQKFGNSNFEKLYKIWVDNSLKRKFADDLLLLELDDKIAGFITFKSEINSATIGLIAVSTEFQGQGIGTNLLQYVENKLASQGVSELHIPTQSINQQACSFYLKSGYQVTNTTFIKHYWKI